MTATMMLHLGTDAPTATVFTMRDGHRWISLEVGGLSLHLPDYDATTVSYAREMAAALTKAADEIDAAIALREVDKAERHDFENTNLDAARREFGDAEDGAL